MKISSADQTIFNKEYVRFDERGHENIKPKPFLKPAMEMAAKKIFKKKRKGKEIFIMNKQYRHGDILLIKIDKLPENIKFKTKKSKVILEGEVTGHAHRLKGNARILEVAERIANNPNGVWDGRIFIANVNTNTVEPDKQIVCYAVVKKPTELIHEEHNTITLPVGNYEIRRQREYDADYIKFVED